MVPILTSYQVWVTTQIYDLREWRTMSQKINIDQDKRLDAQFEIMAKIPERVVPAAFLEEFKELRLEVRGLSMQVNKLTGMLEEHAKSDRPKRSTNLSTDEYPPPRAGMAAGSKVKPTAGG